MDVSEEENENILSPKQMEQNSEPVKKKVPFYKYDTEEFRKFFDFTGGSLFYCLSAVFVAYGIVKIMGPLLSKGEALKEALPCIFTLHAYELALLFVLILIVSRKIVDDAISIVMIIALFLVGTSVALGSMADTDISSSAWLAGVGVAIAFVKFFVMRKFAQIPFKLLSILGLGIVIVCNYFGPSILARSIVVEVLSEPTRREIWWLIWLIMVAGAGIVIIEAMRVKVHQRMQQTTHSPFLQTPAMVYLFTLILVIASGAHQYAMAYTSGLERVMGDYVLVTATAVLLALEILRNLGKQFGRLEIVISCVPLAFVMFAIKEKSVLSGGEFGFSLLGYPPVILALSGLAIVYWSLRNRWYPMLVVGFLYVLGVVLTFDFSPAHPYDLNFIACVGSFVVALIVYGLIKKNQFLCTASIIALCAGLSQWDVFAELAKSCNLTMAGGLAGVYGLSSIVFCVIFGRKMHKALRFIGALSLAVFVFDYLPKDFHWRYYIVLAAIVILVFILWFRAKDALAISIISAPIVIKLYIAAKHLSYWRSVIVGFLLLGAGVFASILKLRIRRRKDSKSDITRSA